MRSREKDQDWVISKSASGNYSYEAAQLAVLQDLRDELKRLNSLLHCHNFVSIPQTLKTIAKQTKKRKYVRKEKK